LVLRATKKVSKAFIQEKTIKRNPESLSNIVNLANLSIQEKAIRILPRNFDFVIETPKIYSCLFSADLFDQNENRQGSRQDFAAINAVSSLLDGI
jgi:hypothetical protein